MTNAARQLIESFDALPEAEKHEVLTELLRRFVSTPYAAPCDDDLTRFADLVFRQYDEHEIKGDHLTPPRC